MPLQIIGARNAAHAKLRVEQCGTMYQWVEEMGTRKRTGAPHKEERPFLSLRVALGGERYDLGCAGHGGERRVVCPSRADRADLN